MALAVMPFANQPPFQAAPPEKTALVGALLNKNTPESSAPSPNRICDLSSEPATFSFYIGAASAAPPEKTALVGALLNKNPPESSATSPNRICGLSSEPATFSL